MSSLFLKIEFIFNYVNVCISVCWYGAHELVSPKRHQVSLELELQPIVNLPMWLQGAGTWSSPLDEQCVLLTVKHLPSPPCNCLWSHAGYYMVKNLSCTLAGGKYSSAQGKLPTLKCSLHSGLGWWKRPSHTPPSLKVKLPNQTLEARVWFCCSATEVHVALIKVFNTGLSCPYTSFPVEIRENGPNVYTEAGLSQSVAARFLAAFHCYYNWCGTELQGNPLQGVCCWGFCPKLGTISHLQSLDHWLFHLQIGPFARPSFILPTLNNYLQSISCCPTKTHLPPSHSPSIQNPTSRTSLSFGGVAELTEGRVLFKVSVNTHK